MGNCRKLAVCSDYCIGDESGPYRPARNNEHLIHTGTIHTEKLFISGRQSDGTLYEHFGELYIETPQTTSLSADIWKKVNGITTHSYLNYFTMSANNRLLHTGSSYTDFFHIESIICFSGSAANHNIDFAVAKNGDIISSSITRNSIGIPLDTEHASIHTLSNLDNNDYIELWAKTSKNTEIIICYYNFLIKRV